MELFNSKPSSWRILIRFGLKSTGYRLERSWKVSHSPRRDLISHALEDAANFSQDIHHVCKSLIREPRMSRKTHLGRKSKCFFSLSLELFDRLSFLHVPLHAMRGDLWWLSRDGRWLFFVFRSTWPLMCCE